MQRRKKEDALHYTFIISIIFKGIDGLIEFFAGIILLFLQKGDISNFIQSIFLHELVQDPTDILANLLIHATDNITSDAISFAMIYLIIHGAIKIGLVTGLYLKKQWVYPLTGVVLGILVIYQILHIFVTHSIVLSILTIIDLMILFLLKTEYKRIKLKNLF